MPAGAVLAAFGTPPPLGGGVVGSASDALPAPLAAAAPRTLSWNLACARFFWRIFQMKYPASRTTRPPSSARYSGLSRNSSSRLGSAGGGAFPGGLGGRPGHGAG